jgi:hypothetical protein
MSIKSWVTELEAIRAEIKSVGEKRKKLKNREKALMESITDFLKAHNQPGVKHQGVAVLLEEKEKHEPKKGKERDSDAMEVLKKYGIHDTEKALKEILNARKGSVILQDSLKFKKIKNNVQ